MVGLGWRESIGLTLCFNLALLMTMSCVST